MSDDVLHEIAALAGLARGFRDARGEHVETPAHVIAAVLQSLRYDLSSPGAMAETLARLQFEAKRLVAATVTLEADVPVSLALTRDPGDVRWRLTFEDGTVREGHHLVGPDGSEAALRLDPLPQGYHRLRLEAEGHVTDTWLIAAPATCYLPNVLAGEGRGFGLTAQVYGLRSSANFGIGDFSDVATLGDGAGRFGAAFLGLSPLHAMFPTDRNKVSPYSPSSRLFIDPFFIDPRRLPDFPASTAGRFLAAPENAEMLDRLRGSRLVDHEGSWALKRAVLGRYWGRVVNSDDPSFAAYRAEGGENLDLHATFEALSEHFAAQGKSWIGDWPEAYRHAHSAAVRQFRDAHPQKVAFHAWLQWVADTQLAAAQAQAIAAGMPIGLYRDLAVGVDKAGAELWAHPNWFVRGVAVGAPPDLLGPDGQNWGLPPFDPRTLEDQGLQPFRTLVAANMRHAGAIRIDHAFQIQRLYVVPDGFPAKQGVYLAFPFEAMLAVLRIESHRAKAIVIAEDLGTAPDGFSDAIMASDVLSYRILNFERYGAAFKPPVGLSAQGARGHRHT